MTFDLCLERKSECASPKDADAGLHLPAARPTRANCMTDGLPDIEELLQGYYGSIYGYLFRLCGCAATTEDLAQEVFVKALRSLHQLREPKAAKAWLFVIARREFSRYCSKPRPQLASECELGEEAVESHVPEGQLEDSEWLQNALDTLPTDSRLMLVMFYYEERSYQQIADELDLPIGTVMSRLSRSKSQLRKLWIESTES